MDEECGAGVELKDAREADELEDIEEPDEVEGELGRDTEFPSLAELWVVGEGVGTLVAVGLTPLVVGRTPAARIVLAASIPPS